MKKQKTKCTLTAETLRVLTHLEMVGAVGGTVVVNATERRGCVTNRIREC